LSCFEEASSVGCRKTLLVNIEVVDSNQIPNNSVYSELLF